MKPFIFVLAALTCGAAMAQNASSTTCGPQLNHLQERLYQKASEGTGALRDFIYIRRGILQLDVYETAEWAGAVSQERAACTKQTAQAQAAPQFTL